jgi:hypothetical protein
MKKNTTYPPTIFLAVDPGAGNLKVYSSCFDPIKIQSLVHYGSPEEFPSGYKGLAADVLHYKNGSSKHLKRASNRYWIVGDSVSGREIQCSTPYDRAQLKTENALPLLLGALILERRIEPGETNIVMVASHHSPEASGKALRNELEGWHEIVCDGRTYRVQIRMPENGVIQEGSAVVADSGREFSTLDIGFLTCMLTPRLRNGQAIPEKTHKTKFGVGELIHRIANSSELKSLPELGGLPGKPSVVVNGIIEAVERSSEEILYRDNGECVAITSIYKPYLKGWIMDVLGEALRKLNQYKGTDYRVIAIGGGVNVPFMRKFLESKGVEVYAGDPLCANVQSIHERHLMPLLSGDLKAEQFEFTRFPGDEDVSPKKVSPKARENAKEETHSAFAAREIQLPAL